MLITFTSQAAAEVTMYKEHARRALALLNKDVNQGVITSNETAQAIKILESAIAESKLHPVSEELRRDVDAHHNKDGDDNEHEAPEPVSFSARMFPLLEMLRDAQKKQRDVIWGA